MASHIIFQISAWLRMARVGWILYSTCRTETMFWWGKENGVVGTFWIWFQGSLRDKLAGAYL